MYINPNTDIRLLKNCPLDNTYEHTIYFNSASAQANYFIGLTKHNLPQNSYNRVNRGRMRVQKVADDCYDCNYLMFRNSAYGNKWFYAFIKSVEYVNNITCEIEFEIDVMQTWFFDYDISHCFVEREHSETDKMWENLVPENVELGDYTITKKEVEDMGKMYVCALTATASEGGSPKGRTINHIYTPLNVIAGIPADDPSSVDALLERFVGEGQEDSIVTIFEYPGWLGDADTSEPKTKSVQLNPEFGDLDGYIPKNKKLYSYPYMMLNVSNSYGQTSEYRWEQWSSESGAGEFSMVGVFLSTPCILLFPKHYRGIVNDYESGLTLSNFPQVPWVGDTFKAWLAQNKGTIATSLMSTTVGAGLTIGGAVTANPVVVAGGVASVGGAVANLVGKTVDVKNTPPQVHGQVQCDSLNVGMGRCEYVFQHMCIRAQFARIIDDYFTMFGYATKRIKKPNRNSRPHWNYVKTVGCSITGSVPVDDMRTICNIYNNGITFWKNGDEVCDYSLDNSPT